jgi:hypothetical protein
LVEGSAVAKTLGVGYRQLAVWYDPVGSIRPFYRPEAGKSSPTRWIPYGTKAHQNADDRKGRHPGPGPPRNRGYRDRVFAEYLDTLNPRANMVMQKALAASPDVRFQEFLERVMTPKYRRASLATIAKGCGIDLLEFNQWWNKASAQRAIAEAQLASLSVVEDLIEAAKSKDDVCDRCDGIGSVAAPPGLEGDIPGYRLAREASEEHGAIYTRTCPKCAGVGTVRRSGDAHARDRLMEIAGLSPGAKGAAVVIQNFSGVSHASAVPMLEEAMNILDVKAERLAEDEAVDEPD